MILKKRIENWNLPLFVIVWVFIGLCVSSICLYMFVKLSINLLDKQSFMFDQKVIDAVRSYSSPVIDRFMLFMTEMGSTVAIALLLVIGMTWLLVKRNNFWGMLYYLIAVGGGGILNLLLKGFFERERPDANPVIEAGGFSFPSGHAMGSMVYYGFLGYLVIRNKRKPVSKIGWGILFSIVILLMGVSRIYLGVHYPSDVLAGYTAGGIWLILCIALLEITYLYRGEGRERVISQ